jgi:hypothetical protein
VSFGALVRLPALTVVLLVFTLVLTDFFDSICTLTGLGKEAGFIREYGVLPNAGRGLFVDALGAVAGGAVSSSLNTVYVESASGIADGARTGLANVVTGLLFLGAMVLTPLYSVIPIEAAAPALVVVGGGRADGGAGARDRLLRLRDRAADVTHHRDHAVHLLDRERHRRGVHQLGAAARGDGPDAGDPPADVGGRSDLRRLLRDGLIKSSCGGCDLVRRRRSGRQGEGDVSPSPGSSLF